MLKRKIFKKISLVICCLLIIGILIIFPKKGQEEIVFKTNKDSGVIYLLDEDDYLASVDYRYNAQKDEDLIKEMIKVLTINSDEVIAIQRGFKAIIPENTTLLHSSLKDGIASLDFSKDILNIEEKYEERMIEAIIKKANSPKTLIKYSDYLEALEGTFTTNISTDQIMSLVNMQLDKMPEWEINKISLNGTDGSEITYSDQSRELYVMYPDDETVESAKAQIQELMGEV